MRIDKYLTNKYPNLSRAYIKDQIKLGNFLVYPEQSRGVVKKVKPFYVLRESDQVGFTQGFSLPAAAQILPNPAIKLNIIYEDENVIVINKPAGLSVHPRQDKNGLPLLQEIDTTLVSGLLAYYPAIASVGDPSTHSTDAQGGERSRTTSSGQALLRPGIVHRLDKDTSGVMIIAKNQASFDWLKKQFKERQTIKKYLALVHGSLKNKEGEIKTLLHRAKKDPTKQKVSKNEGKEAITQYKVLKEYNGYSLLEASPKTGRLHQIRVHLVHLGHPVMGDTKYGPKPKLDFGLPLKSSFKESENPFRQFLHAQELEITLLGGPKKTFSAPIPADLQAILDALEKI